MVVNRTGTVITRDEREFVVWIAHSAAVPYKRRGNLDEVRVCADMHIMNRGSADITYKFSAYFIYPVVDNRTLTQALYEKEVKLEHNEPADEELSYSLSQIFEKVNKINPSLKARVEGQTLVVDSFFKTNAEL